MVSHNNLINYIEKRNWLTEISKKKEYIFHVKLLKTGVLRSIYIQNINKLFHKFLFHIYKILIVISTLYILKYYHDAGNMHDAGVYVDSGLAVFKGENPYECCSRWGSFGPVPFSAFIVVFPLAMQAAVVRLLSLAGIYMFLRTFFPTKVEKDRYLIFLVIIWCSPVRELMVTNQMTGICIGLVALGVKIHELHGRYKYSKTLEIVSATLFAIALDMKPHITIIFFISWCIYRKAIKLFAYVIIVLMSTHALIDFSQNKYWN